MAWSFGDGFDVYAVTADMISGYWDSGTANVAFGTGRFSGSRAISLNTAAVNPQLVKASSVNDAVHHICVAFTQTGAISGTTNAAYIHIRDGTTAQCSIVFRSDGAILLTSGIHTGTTLATYTGAVTASNTWYQFEFEVIINNTTGSFTVRKNGNSVSDFTLGSLNTRGGTANNYANAIGVGCASTTPGHWFDDLFWRSDATSVAWMGDIRCYTRMPASDASVQFSRAPTSTIQTPFTGNVTLNASTTVSFYTPFTAVYDGTISTGSVTFSTGYTGNLKCSIFASSGGAPAAILGSATTLVNPPTGANTLTFGTPVAIVKGAQYWVGFATDSGSGVFSGRSLSGSSCSTVGYSTFPTASPTISSPTATAPICSLTVSISTNSSVVGEAQQDALTSYVYDSTPGHADLYGIASIASTPATVIATTVRAYAQKSDAGTRTLAVNLKSGATTVASPTLTLTTSGWTWAWRTDTTDPATGAAWTAVGVNNAQIGPTVVA